VPWCEECAKYFAPSAMREDGSCPSCGRAIEAPQPITAKNINLKQLAQGDSDEDASAPWHFKLLMVMLAGYLGWRVIALFG
jgi:hypothetical protein